MKKKVSIKLISVIILVVAIVAGIIIHASNSVKDSVERKTELQTRNYMSGVDEVEDQGEGEDEEEPAITWDDLSQMIQLYEMNSITVDESLISQYIQNSRIAKDFSVYYDLYLKYKSDYQIESILEGKSNKAILKRAKDAKFDERLALIGMLLDSLNYSVKAVIEEYNGLTELAAVLKNFKILIVGTNKNPKECLSELVQKMNKDVESAKVSGHLSKEDITRLKNNIEFINNNMANIGSETDCNKVFKFIKNNYDERVKAHKVSADLCGKRIANAFSFLEKAFDEGQEILIVVTEMTSNGYFAKYISLYGCDSYFKHNKNLLFYERQNEIDRALENLKLDT